MKKNKLFASLLCLLVSASCISEQLPFYEKALKHNVRQIRRTLDQLHPADYNKFPRNIAPEKTEWTLRTVTKEEWTAGFWPGVLWYDYEYTKDEKVRGEAERYTETLEFFSRIPAYDHDLGFLVFNSYGNGYRLTGNESYKDVILATADTLATLFNPTVGTMLSWPREIDLFGGHNTIMDNMINLEMLFWASENGGNPELKDVAIRHADTTMKYGFQSDGTAYHVVVYDGERGDFIRGCTHQGYADLSMWARGQSWAIYGYTVCYRFTRDQRYLDFAQKVADIYLERLPGDMIPFWDFDDPDIPHVSRDASAAAVVASALLELSSYADKNSANRYRDASEKMLQELNENYRGIDEPALLLHSTGHRPAGSEIDYAIIYADYYYMEALLRLKRLCENMPVV